MPSTIVNDLKSLARNILEIAIFPAVDKFVEEWKAPFKIDDKIWDSIKQRIRDLFDGVDVTPAPFGVSFTHTTDGVIIMDAGGFNIKEALKSWLTTKVFPFMDEWTQNWNTPFQLDDKLWALLRRRIEDYLNNVQIVRHTSGEFEVITA